MCFQFTISSLLAYRVWRPLPSPALSPSCQKRIYEPSGSTLTLGYEGHLRLVVSGGSKVRVCFIGFMLERIEAPAWEFSCEAP